MFVITGGGSGIGQALTFALAQRGHHVMIVGRHEDTLRETADCYASIDYCCVDITDTVQRSHLVDVLLTRPMLQGLVNNAGIIEPITAIDSLDINEWRSCMNTNLEAPMFLTQALLPRLHQGRILNIGSGAAYFPIAGWAAYCVSKAGLSMLTRCWQLEHPSLAVASVMPGIIDTAMQAKIRESDRMNADKHDFFCRLKAAHQLLSPETVAAFLAWLLLDVSGEQYVAQEWDIYDTAHHSHWLIPPNVVPNFQE